MIHTYTPEELASLARKVGATSITVTGPDIAADSVDITAVRAALYHDGSEHLRQSRHYYKLMCQEAGLKTTGERAELGEIRDVAPAMYAALASAVTFQWTVSAILRLLERESPEMAQKAADIVALVQDVGIEAIEDANDDLTAHLTTPGCHKCGVVFTFPHESLEHSQEPGTVYCRGCAKAVAK